MVALTQIGVILAKLETTPGVGVTPDSETDFIQALEVNFNPDFNLIQRNYLRPSLSQVPHIMGRQLATISFTTEVFGTGVAAADTDETTQSQATPKWADLLEACAMSGAAVSTPAGKVYSPLTSAQKTISIWCHYEGILHKLTGCMGSFTINAEAGQIATINWNFMGVYNAPVATSVPTDSVVSTLAPPLVESCSFLIGGTASTVFVPGSISLELANSVIPRADANSAKGFNSMYITGRSASINFSPEAVPEASHPFWADFAGATGKAVSLNIGSTAGNQVLIAIPNMQISNLQYSDRDGIRIYEVSGAATTATATGNNEFTLKFV
jgi:hypothetical protein